MTAHVRFGNTKKMEMTKKGTVPRLAGTVAKTEQTKIKGTSKGVASNTKRANTGTKAKSEDYLIQLTHDVVDLLRVSSSAS